MTADWFFEFNFAIAVGLFYSAFDDAVFVSESIHAHLAFYGRRYPAKIFIVLIPAIFFNPPYTFFSEIRFYRFVNFVDQFKFVFFEWSASVAIFTTTAFAFHQIANKLRLYHSITYQHIVYCDHLNYLNIKLLYTS